jgi:hypothetical protein
VSFAGVHHIVFDHCDFSGASDEALDITYAHDVTIQWSSISNSGPGSQYGLLLAYSPTTRISYHHNMSANHANRCGAHMHWDDGGVLAENADIDIRNNVLHNCAYESFFDTDLSGLVVHGNGNIRINAVGNYFKAGPNTHTGSVGMFGFDNIVQIHETDNYYPGYPVFPVWSSPQIMSVAFDFPLVTTVSAQQAYSDVLAQSGAWPRDAMNSRTVNEVHTGSGSLANISDALIQSGPAAPQDQDRDGMPDTWETAHGLDAGSDDSALDQDNDGWTNIEEYLDERAGELINP